VGKKEKSKKGRAPSKRGTGFGGASKGEKEVTARNRVHGGKGGRTIWGRFKKMIRKKEQKINTDLVYPEGKKSGSRGGGLKKEMR